MYTPSAPSQITRLHPVDDDGNFLSPESEASGSHTLTDHGGPKLTDPKLLLLFYGDASEFDPQIVEFAADLMTKGYLSPARAQGVTGTPSYLGGRTLQQNYGQSLSQAVCYAIISGAIADGLAPQPDGQTIYALFLPAGVNVSALGGSNCQTFCGFHSSANTIHYAVIPDTSCPSCHGSNTPFDALCMVLAHEVVETATDPTGQGWYEDSTGDENADLCAWQPVPYGPWTVQPYWVGSGCTYGQYQSAPPPPPTDLEARVTAIEQTLAKVKAAYG